ncbi:MAG: MoaD/ThiS family protein [Bacteroidota bacterium]
MNIKTLFFGVTRDIIGEGSAIFDLNEDLTIADFQNILTKNYSGLTDIKSFAVAVNEEYVTEDYKIQENDIIAIIPPVSGG